MRKASSAASAGRGLTEAFVPTGVAWGTVWKLEVFCRATLFSGVDEGQVPEEVSESWQPLAQSLQERGPVLTVSDEQLERPACCAHTWPASAVVEAGASAGDSLPQGARIPWRGK